MNWESNLRNKVIILTFRSSCLLLLVLFVVITSCAPKETEINFKIENGSSTNIFVEYFAFANNDTNTLQINPTETQIIWKVTHTSQLNNWYSDYRIQINTIKNMTGDSINFDPNVASKWQLLDPNRTTYLLQISDGSF